MSGEPPSGIPLDEIEVPAQRRRRLDQGAVARLAESMRTSGLLNAITVRRNGTGYALIAGAHRLAAARLLNSAEIAARVLDVDDAQAQIIEIDENLIRADLTALERAEHLTERKRLYEQRYPETRGGVAGALAKHGSANATVAFADDAATHTGLSRRTIEQSTQIGTAIVSDVRDTLRETETASSTTALAALAALPADAQRTVVATADLSAPSSVRKLAKTAKPAPKRRAPRRSTPRAVIPSRPEPVTRFVFTVGALHRLVELDAAAVAPLLSEHELGAYRDVVDAVRAWFVRFDQSLAGTS